MIPLPLQPKVVEKKDNQAVFEIEGLYPGYGITVGNSLRRVLLSSLPGAAVTQVKIKGAQHEFSTLAGVREDVVNILLNIKQLRFKLYGEEPQRAKLSVRGAKTVKGSAFQLPSQLELMSRDALVATLTGKSAHLEIEILVEKGLGYELAETRKKGKLEIGTIALDAIFTPVRKVSYRVENMRVGDRTDFDRLIIDLETDGTMTPEEALSQACGILVQHFSLMCESLKQKEEAEARKAVPKKKVKKTKKAKAVKKTKKHAQKKKRKKTK